MVYLLKQQETWAKMLRIVLSHTKQTINLQLTTFNPFTSKHKMSINTEGSISSVNMGENNTEATEVSQIG